MSDDNIIILFYLSTRTLHVYCFFNIKWNVTSINIAFNIHVTFEGKAKKNILQRTAKSEANLRSSLQPHMYTQKIATIFDHI